MGRPASADPTATRKATVTFSASSSPVREADHGLGVHGGSFWRSDRDRVAPGSPGHGAAAPSSSAADQPVLDGEQRGAGAVVDAGLEVDVLEVVAHGLGADHQPAGDLAGAAAARHQAEHLHLARRQPGRSRASEARRDARPPASTASTAAASRRPARTSARSLRRRLRRASSAGRCGRGSSEPAVAVGGREDPLGHRQRGAAEPTRVAGAVEALAVRLGDRAPRPRSPCTRLRMRPVR